MADDDYNDFFDGPDLEEKPEIPDPDTLDTKLDDDKDTTIVKKSIWRKILIYFVSILVVGLVVGCYLRFFYPYIKEGRQVGYITKVEKRGFLFQTYEGEILTGFEVADTAKVYEREFSYSIDNDSIANIAMDLQQSGKRVVLSYKQYQGVLPWRGSSKNIITGIQIPKN